MIGQKELFALLDTLNIPFKYLEHEPIPTVEAALAIRGPIEGVFCKNLFFRNHKGDKHYLVCFDHTKQLPVKDLELKLKQGKLSFASEQRMEKYLGLKPGSVSAFGLINDEDKHVKLFLDSSLKVSKYVSFHPNDNRATLIVSFADLMKFLNHLNVNYEFIAI